MRSCISPNLLHRLNELPFLSLLPSCGNRQKHRGEGGEAGKLPSLCISSPPTPVVFPIPLLQLAEKKGLYLARLEKGSFGRRGRSEFYFSVHFNVNQIITGRPIRLPFTLDDQEGDQVILGPPTRGPSSSSPLSYLVLCINKLGLCRFVFLINFKARIKFVKKGQTLFWNSLKYEHLQSDTDTHTRTHTHSYPVVETRLFQFRVQLSHC